MGIFNLLCKLLLSMCGYMDMHECMTVRDWYYLVATLKLCFLCLVLLLNIEFAY